MIRRTRPLRTVIVAILLCSVVSLGFIVGVLFDAVEVSSLQDITDENLIHIQRASHADESNAVFVQHGEFVLQPVHVSAPRPGTSRDDVAADEGPVVDGHSNVERYNDDDWLLEQLPVSSSYSIWPSNNKEILGYQADRILTQLKYVPRSYKRSQMKIIYLPAGLGELAPGRSKFIADRCPVDACWLTSSSRYDQSADVLLLQGDAFFDADVRKPPNQIWVLWLLESPPNTPHFRNAERLINWTATYRSDSTIVTPYEKYVRFDQLGLSTDVRSRLKTQRQLRPSSVSAALPYAEADNVWRPHQFGEKSNRPLLARNFASGRTGLVAWLVSNCVANNGRYAYVQELRQFIPVDIYGDCGELQCPRYNQTYCDKMIRRRYKFYMAFENSNCDGYITEKFFRNALWNDVVPIVMGARKSQYEQVAPPHSFIHVDDFRSPRDLASHLLRVNASDRMYNEYMAWKSPEIGRFVDTRFWCRLCAMAHDDSGHVTWYDDVERWWRNEDSCTPDRWANSSIG